MSSMNFKLSAVAITVFTALNANAALYRVELIDVPSDISNVSSYTEVRGVAINPSNAKGAMGCFGADCTAAGYQAAAETRVTVDGLSYREELPFAMDRGFVYLDEYDDFKSYCYRELLYSTCESWADTHWAPWNSELNGSTASNALAFVEGATYTNSLNNVINSIDDSGNPIGNQVTVGATSSVERTIEVVAPVVPSDVGQTQSRAWQSKSGYTVGSIATLKANDQGDHHTSKAAIWGSNGVPVQLAWPSNSEKDGELLAQGSMRDLVVKNGNIYGVGFNTYADDNYINASVFEVSEGSYQTASSWSTTEINNAQSKIDGDFIHTNSVATGINDNLVVIGTAKLSGGKPKNGAAGNRIFVVPDASGSSLSATFLSDSVFFDGAGGKAGAINNYNEIVGAVDAEDTRENDGKPRRQRGFIKPYNVNTERSQLFNNSTQYLDNLTNGDTANVPAGTSAHNNQFRIIDATDINDDGVISGTALYCAGGYDSTKHNAYCGGGSTDDKTVAVKLIPINGVTWADDASGVTRGVDNPPVERSGGGLGWLGLTLLGLIRFRQK